MNYLKNRTIILFIGFFIFFGFIQEAQAFFDLSVAPRRGGNHIRFEEGKPGGLLRNEEVTVSVTSTLNAQYRIYQTVYQPLINEYGNVIPQNNLIVFSPSNPLGTLRTQLETPVTMGQMPVYTSNAAGESDEFVLVFNVRVPDDQPGGIYHTQITFTAEPVNAQAGETPKSMTMDIRVDITRTFNITIENVKGGRDLNLGKINQDQAIATDGLKVQIDGSIGASFNLTQRIIEPLTSQDGNSLDEGALSIVAAGATRGKLAGGGASLKLSSSAQLLYTSDESGGADAFEIQYQLSDAVNQKAGIYSGMISFKVESNSALPFPETINVPVKVEVEPIFYLDMEIEKDTAIGFGTFRGTGEKRDKKVLLTVHSNIAKQYQVSQIISSKLTNEEGVAVPPNSFTYFGTDAKTGVLSALASTECAEGESVVFTSDAKGTAESFMLNYSLQLPKDERPGNYQSNVKYSITTL